ncbi:MAG: NADP-dependent oxidoreductase [Acidobacteriia bacterium]|nr:NADP-dependent oxidoreductase [Terriglobia bacterium]
MEGVNHQIILAARPAGMPKESDFELIESPMPRLRPGEVLVRTLYLSVDPYMRGRMRQNGSYARAVELGEVMVGGIVGQVVESNDPRLECSDVVEGMLGWQEYAAAPTKTLRRINASTAPISTSLYVLGMPGLTAYFGLLDICRPQPGETVVVSGAAGAVGSIVGQIAKIKRCRAIGIAGTDEKIQFITEELGFDSGFNYKSVQDYHAKLKELCPTGIDVYFDNVGGQVTDAVMAQINTRARIAVCGQISHYNSDSIDSGPRCFSQLLTKQAKAEGFLVFQYADRYEEGLRQLSTWLREGRLKYREDIMEGLENAPKAFIRMLQGKNIGKQLVKVG